MPTTSRLPLLFLPHLHFPDLAAPSSQTCPAAHTSDPSNFADPNNSLYAPPADSAAAAAAVVVVDADSVDAVVDSEGAVDTAAAISYHGPPLLRYVHTPPSSRSRSNPHFRSYYHNGRRTKGQAAAAVDDPGFRSQCRRCVR